MNSIDKNQPEENHKDLQSSEAIRKIQELVKMSDTCFFVTTTVTTQAKGSEGSRPMSTQKADDYGALYFLSASDSNKNAEIAADPHVKLYYQGSAHSDFLFIAGKAQISKDKELIKELWNPILKTWFTEGVDDPRITVIKVYPESGYYWDNKHGNFVASIKMLAGAAIGKTLDDSIEGKLDPK
jgi:general stress protein 26